MDGSIFHRGPDDNGTYVDERCAMGMRRLSIIDLGGGKQPITTEDERYWIVFNGEIYNYRLLREGLLARGHTLHDHERHRGDRAPVRGARRRRRRGAVGHVRLRHLGSRSARS